MAYNVKYELEFSDIDENPRKLQILELDYVGSILPIIGTSNPVSIRYEESKEEYAPILPSTMTVNLIETDDVSYENFYLLGEKQFKTILWYKDTGDIWRHYWQGFIIPDTYFQPIKTKPFNISLKAACGLSLLKGVPHELTHGDYYTALDYIEHCLDNTDNLLTTEAELDSYIDLVNLTEALDNSNIGSDIFYTSKEKAMNCYDIISMILRAFNCRIQQSKSKDGALSINSIYSIINYGISESVSDVLTFPDDLTIIGSDLVKSNKGAVNSISLKNNIKYNKGLRNNAFQNFGLDGWGLFPSFGGAIIRDSDEVYKGYYSIKMVGSGSYSSSYITQDLTYGRINTKSVFSIGFDYFPVGGSNGSWRLLLRKNNGDYRTWNDSTKSWTSSYVDNIVEEYNSQSWKKISAEIEIPDIADYDNLQWINFTMYSDSSSSVQYIFDNVVFSPIDIKTSTGDFSNSRVNREVSIAPTTVNGSRVLSFDKPSIISELDTYIDGKVCGTAVTSVEDAKGQPLFIRRGYTGSAQYKTIEDIVLTQRINDTSDESSYYEGTFKKTNNGSPVSINDVLHVDYNTFSETKKIVLTSLEWSVKDNIYRFSGYLAYNSTTDVDSTIITNYD